MNTGTTSRLARTALRGAAVGAALACASGLSLADDAKLSIAWFGVSAEQFSGNYVVATNPYQSFAMSALDGGGIPVTDTFAANDWAMGLNRIAQSTYAAASGNTVGFTDPFTQLATVGVNLSASAVQSGAQSNIGSATATQSGGFTLIDANGDAVAGSITFDLYYDLSVQPPSGVSAQNYAQTVIGLLISSASGAPQSFSDGLLSSSLAGGSGSTSGHFTWTLNLAAGEFATYSLNASAIAVAVPEPSSYAMLAAGLCGIGVIAGRRGKRPS